MPSLRNDATRTAIVERLLRLTPAATAKWGSFDAASMLCHLNDALVFSIGGVKAKSANRRAFQHFPLKHLS